MALDPNTQGTVGGDSAQPATIAAVHSRGRGSRAHALDDCVEHNMPKYVIAGSEGCMVTRVVILCELWAVVPMT